MPARRREDPANKTVRTNIKALIATYEITDPDLLVKHNTWQQHTDLEPTQIRLHELGAEVGMSESMLWKKLHGQHRFTIGEVKAIARFFGVTADDILNDKKASRGRKPAGTTP